MKEFYRKYKHGLPMIIYSVIYLVWFAYLEQRQVKASEYMNVHMTIDNYIPFCEVFVVPYLLWFLYIPAVLIYLFFKDREGYWRNGVFLGTGMTVILIFSTCIPNVHHLRLKEFPVDNVFTWMIGLLWKTDTATNLFPSIHVFNSIGAHLAVLNNKELSENKKIRYGSLVLCILIIMSTVLIKQHSMFDVLTAFIMAAAMYVTVYYYDIVGVCQHKYRYQAARRARKRARMS